VNYLTIPAARGDASVLGVLPALSLPETTPSTTQLWAADAHVIGKDIVKFHAVLLADHAQGDGPSLPRQLLVHGFWQKDGAKMSKTTGNIVEPLQVIDEWGLDAFRYYVTRELDIGPDGNWTDGGFSRVTRPN
jgi:methionyl-tRNA synthetase